MIKIERADVHMHGENVSVIEVWRTTPDGNAEIIALIPLEDEDERVEVEL